MEINAFDNHKSHRPLFYEWFIKWKAEDFRNCTLRNLREDVVSVLVEQTIFQGIYSVYCLVINYSLYRESYCFAT